MDIWRDTRPKSPARIPARFSRSRSFDGKHLRESEAAARFGINVADVQDAIQTAVGGNAVTQLLQGEARYDVVIRYLPRYRNTQEAIDSIRLLSPSGERVSLAQLTTVKTEDGAEEVYREGGQRYVAIKYSVRDRDLGSTVEEAIAKVEAEAQRDNIHRRQRYGPRVPSPKCVHLLQQYVLSRDIGYSNWNQEY